VHVVDAAATVLFEAAFANLHPNAATKVDFFREDRAPLLFVSFGEGHIGPPEAVYHMSQKYSLAETVVDYREFEERPHFAGAPGWEEVADYALSWAAAHHRSGTQMTTAGTT
jgi:hypothetical protein